MKLSDNLKLQVEQATVTLNKKGCRGVLVPGNIILTVAHCVDYSCSGEMVLRDVFLEEINTGMGAFSLAPWAVEPVADVAILGEPDNQGPFQQDIELLESFCVETTPLQLCTKDFELGQPFPVYVFTQERVWVEGKAKQTNLGAHSLWVEYEGAITGGTSGSAIVNDAAEIVALVSIARGSFETIDTTPHGIAPRPHLALPVWAVQKITTPQSS